MIIKINEGKIMLKISSSDCECKFYNTTRNSSQNEKILKASASVKRILPEKI